MRIDVDAAMSRLESKLSMDRQATAMTRGLLEYVDTYYDGEKPERLLLKILAPVGFTDEILSGMIADGIVTFD